LDELLNEVGRRHCGTYRRPYVMEVTGNEVTIVFKSDKSNSKKGFSLTYKGMVSTKYGVLLKLNKIMKKSMHLFL